MNVRTVQWVVLGVSLGAIVGIGGYTFIYARGASYLTNQPAACANCHIMDEHYRGWLRSSHRAVAVCNDCHTPPGFVNKYFTKASNGFWHSFAFTTGRFHEPLEITERNRRITEQSCRNCHQPIVEAIEGIHHAGEVEQLSCVRCHNSVGHQR